MPATREAINFAGEFSLTEGGQRFLLHHDNNGIVVFASDEDLQHIAASDILLLDGTFNSSSCLFYQLYVRHFCRTKRKTLTEDYWKWCGTS